MPPILIVHVQNAHIKIDIDRTIGEVDSLIYNFLEHLGFTFYEETYDPNSPHAKKEIRTDVIETARDLNVALLRYPGGNFVPITIGKTKSDRLANDPVGTGPALPKSAI